MNSGFKPFQIWSVVSNHFKYDQWFQIISNMISGFKQLRIWSVVSNHFKYDQWLQTTSNMISGFKPIQIWSVESNNFNYQWFETRRFLSLQGNYMYNFDPVLADNSENQNKLLTTTKIKKKYFVAFLHNFNTKIHSSKRQWVEARKVINNVFSADF
jgi:hypothetical protein